MGSKTNSPKPRAARATSNRRKADHHTDRAALQDLQQIVNIGPSIAGNLQRAGVRSPQQLIDADPLDLYRRICRVDGVQHDPCLIDCLMAAVDFMSGHPPRAWWKYTPHRKRLLAEQAD